MSVASCALTPPGTSLRGNPPGPGAARGGVAPGRGRPGTWRPSGVAGGLLLLASFFLLAPATLAGQQLELESARQMSGEDTLHLRVEYGAGRLTVAPGADDLLYRARMRYDPRIFEAVRRYERDGGTARVQLGLTAGGEGFGVAMDWGDLDLDIRGLDRLRAGADDGRMRLELGRRIPTDLELRTGASQSELRLGGVPLRRLRLATGASETTLLFDEPNPIPMEELSLKAGAASLTVRGLGNAGARTVSVESAVGEVTLDFSGRWRRDARVRIKTGLGAVTIRVPSRVGVRVEKSSLLGSFSGAGLTRAPDGSYRTENWSEAEHRLELEVDTAFGSVEVDRIP